MRMALGMAVMIAATQAAAATLQAGDVLARRSTSVVVLDRNGVAKSELDLNAMAPPAPTDKRFNFVRSLRGGGFVGGVMGAVRFYDAGGSIRRSIVVDNYAVCGAFSQDGRFLWIAGGDVEKIRLSDGVVTVRLSLRDVSALSVVGEQRPSIDEIAPSSLMALDSCVLTIIAMAIIALALRRPG
jgi:hypothetical protein